MNIVQTRIVVRSQILPLKILCSVNLCCYQYTNIHLKMFNISEINQSIKFAEKYN